MSNNSEYIRMSANERTELAKLLRARGRVVRNQIDAQKAVQLAKVEQQLAAKSDKYDDAWKELAVEVDEKIKQLDKQIVASCHDRGIPQQFRPQACLSWYGRGENASKERRAELRRMAQTTIEARAKTAKVQVDQKEAEVLGQIVLAGLTSEEAKRFITTMPTIEALMPQIELSELERRVPLLGGEI
jgi:DNA primase